MLRVEIGDSRGAVGGRSAAWFIWIKVEQLNKRDSNSVVGCFVFFSPQFKPFHWLILMQFFNPLLLMKNFCASPPFAYMYFLFSSTSFMAPTCLMFLHVIMAREEWKNLLFWSSSDQKNNGRVHEWLRKCTQDECLLLIFGVYLLSNYKERQGFLLEYSLYTWCPRIIDNIITNCKILNKSTLLGDMLFHFQTRNNS